MKNGLIEFTPEVVDKVYTSLPIREKCFRDENGILWKLDPVMVVRESLEGLGYNLDSAWYSWATKAPERIENGEGLGISTINREYFKDIFSDFPSNDLKGLTKAELSNKLLGLDNNANKFQRLEVFDYLTADHWYQMGFKDILYDLKQELTDNLGLRENDITIAIAPFIDENGIIKFALSVNGDTKNKYYKGYKMSKYLSYKFNKKGRGLLDIFIIKSPLDRIFEIPNLGLSSENHAEIKIFEFLRVLLKNDGISLNSKVILLTSRDMCVTCRMVYEQLKFLNKIKHNSKGITLDFYDDGCLDTTQHKDTFPKSDLWQENFDKFKEIYKPFFESVLINPSLEVDIENILIELWNKYQP